MASARRLLQYKGVIVGDGPQTTLKAGTCGAYVLAHNASRQRGYVPRAFRAE